MSNAFVPAFSYFSDLAVSLYEADPAKHHKLILELLTTAAAVGYFTQAEALRDRLYSFEAGQPL